MLAYDTDMLYTGKVLLKQAFLFWTTVKLITHKTNGEIEHNKSVI